MRRLAVAGSVLAALSLSCAHDASDRKHPVASEPECKPRVAVHVLDEQGQPLANVRVYSSMHAWMGPEGAFYREAGQDRTLRSPPVLTDHDGRAVVCDALEMAEEFRKQLDAHNEAHPQSLPFAGGFGQMQVGPSRGSMLVAEREGWPTAHGALVPRAELVLGPARTVVVTPTDLQCADTSSATSMAREDAEAGSTKIEGVRLPNGDFRFEGLGPQRYTIVLGDRCGPAQFLDGRKPTQSISFASRHARVEARSHAGRMVTLGITELTGPGQLKLTVLQQLPIGEEGELELSLPRELASEEHYCAYLKGEHGNMRGELHDGQTVSFPRESQYDGYCVLGAEESAKTR